MCYSLGTMISFDKLNNLIAEIKASSDKITIDGAILHVVNSSIIDTNDGLDSLKKFAKVEEIDKKSIVLFKDDPNYKNIFRKKLSKLYKSYKDEQHQEKLSEVQDIKSSLIKNLSDVSSFSPSKEDKIIFSLVRLYESNDVLLGNEVSTKTKVLDFDFVNSQKYIAFRNLFSKMLESNSLTDITYYISNYQTYYSSSKKSIYRKISYRGLERYGNEFSAYKNASVEHMMGYNHINLKLKSPIASLINAVIHDYLNDEDLLSRYWSDKIIENKHDFLLRNPFSKPEFINMYSNLLDCCQSNSSKKFLSFMISIIKDDYLRFMFYSSDLFATLVNEEKTHQYDFIYTYSGISNSDAKRFQEGHYLDILPEIKEVRSIFGIDNISIEDYENFINDLDSETYKSITYRDVDFINIPLIRKVFYTDD